MLGWCSWLSHIVNTDEVVGSSPALSTPFVFLLLVNICSSFYLIIRISIILDIFKSENVITATIYRTRIRRYEKRVQYDARVQYLICWISSIMV